MIAGMRSAAIVLSGNELLDGRVSDSNGSLVGAELSGRGVKVTSIVTVADDAERLTAALRYSLAAEPDLLIVGGGLGTTHDDLTAECLADVLGVTLEEDAGALAMLERSLRGVAERRHTTLGELLPTARRQARIPVGTEPLTPVGVAPGIVGRSGKTRIYAFPGVPHEFRVMWRRAADDLAAQGFFPPVVQRVARVVGSGEPPVAAVIDREPHDRLEVGVTIDGGEVTVKLRYLPVPEAEAEADGLIAALQRAVTVFSTDGRTIDDIVADLLVARGQSLAVAESCTGGLLGGRITERPGASAYFLGGVVSYANEVKEELLGVPPLEIDRYGAVSPEVAGSMAMGVQSACRATYGVSVTGIAGPDGGSAEKPIGLVYLGCSGPAGVRVVREQFPGDRAMVRAHAAGRALHLVRECLCL